MKKLLSFVLVAFAIVGFTCCNTTGLVAVATPQSVIIDLKSTSIPDNQYYDLTKGLRIEVSSSVADSQILDYSALDSKTAKALSSISITVDPPIRNFVNNSMTSYVRSMGISVGRDVANDLILQINVKTFKVIYETASSGRAVVELDYTLLDSDRETILHQVSRGRATWSGTITLASILDKAYGQALKDIDWDGIANNLKINKRADQEQQKQVKGDGDTALEHTVIMWRVVSAPAGADVYWRIVSSTPDVKNTNSTYLGTTPYEATESFNVRGLTFENSGNVQVEIVCEKPGYLTQSKRFNLRQAIEQREISTKFNLIKDE